MRRHAVRSIIATICLHGQKNQSEADSSDRFDESSLEMLCCLASITLWRGMKLGAFASLNMPPGSLGIFACKAMAFRSCPKLKNK